MDESVCHLINSIKHTLSLHSNGHFARSTWVSRYQNVSILDFVRAKDDGGGEWWQLEL